MKRNGDYLALAVSPTGVRAALVELQGAQVIVRRREEVDWDGFVPELVEKKPRLAELFRSMRSHSRAKPKALISYHPFWVLQEKMEVPPAQPAEVQAFIALSLQRQLFISSPEELRWRWDVADANGSAAPLASIILVNPSATKVIEEALASAGIIPVFSAPAPVVAAHAAKLPDNSIYTDFDETGFALLNATGSGMNAFSWLPKWSDGGDEALSRALVDAQPHENTDAPVYYRGDAALAQQLYPERTAKAALHDNVARLGDSTRENDLELAGLIQCHVNKRHELNLQERDERSSLSGKALQLVGNTRRLVTIAAVLLVALVGTVFAKSKLEARWSNRVVAMVGEVQIDEAALQADITALQQLARTRMNPLDLLVELEKAKPDGVSLNQVEMDHRAGASASGTAPSLEVVEQFATRINDIRDFEKARTVDTKINDKTISFKINWSLKKK